MTLPYDSPQDFEGSKRFVWEGEDVGNAQWAKHAAPTLRQCKSLVKYTRECNRAGRLPVVIVEKEEQLFPGEKVAWCTDNYSLGALEPWYGGPAPVSTCKLLKQQDTDARSGRQIIVASLSALEDYNLKAQRSEVVYRRRTLQGLCKTTWDISAIPADKMFNSTDPHPRWREFARCPADVGPFLESPRLVMIMGPGDEDYPAGRNPFIELPQDVLDIICAFSFEVDVSQCLPFERLLLHYSRWEHRAPLTHGFGPKPFEVVTVRIDISRPPSGAPWPPHGAPPVGPVGTNPALPVDLDFPTRALEDLRLDGFIRGDGASPLRADLLLDSFQQMRVLGLFIGAHLETQYPPPLYRDRCPIRFPRDNSEEWGIEPSPVRVQGRLFRPQGQNEDFVQPLVPARTLSLEFGKADWPQHKRSFYRLFSVTPPSFINVGSRFEDALDGVLDAVYALRNDLRATRNRATDKIFAGLREHLGDDAPPQIVD